MNQFNQAAAEIDANLLCICGTYSAKNARELYIRGRKDEWASLQPLPTPEVIEFDLEKLKTGEWGIRHVSGNEPSKWKYDEEFDIVIIQWTPNRGAVVIERINFDLLRLIRKPVPTNEGETLLEVVSRLENEIRILKERIDWLEGKLL
jgi:hypothetical protein